MILTSAPDPDLNADPNPEPEPEPNVNLRTTSHSALHPVKSCRVWTVHSSLFLQVNNCAHMLRNVHSTPLAIVGEFHLAAICYY